MAIILPSGFNITNIDPIDSRFTVATQAARLGFSAANVYNGLIVFQQDTNELYVLTNTGSYNSVTGWQLIGTPTGSFATTGSNRFNGDQIISGSLSIKSTSTGSIINTINLSGSNVFQVTNAGRFIVSRSVGDSGQTVNVYGNQDGSDGMYFQNDNKGSSAGIQLLMGNDKIAASGSDNFFQIYKGSMNNYNIPDGTQIVEYGTGGIRIASFGRPSTAPSSSGPISFAIGGIGSVNEVVCVFMVDISTTVPVGAGGTIA